MLLTKNNFEVSFKNTSLNSNIQISLQDLVLSVKDNKMEFRLQEKYQDSDSLQHPEKDRRSEIEPLSYIIQNLKSNIRTVIVTHFDAFKTPILSFEYSDFEFTVDSRMGVECNYVSGDECTMIFPFTFSNTKCINRITNETIFDMPNILYNYH